MKRDLQIVACNACGLRDRVNELREFVGRVKPDVLLLSETHLSAASRRVTLHGYALYRDDTPARTGGGTAIAVKTSVGHSRVQLPPREHIEATAVELHAVLGGLLVVSAYKPPGRDLLRADL